MSKRKLERGTEEKNPHDSEMSTQMIPTVVRIVMSPLKANAFSMITSPDRFTVVDKLIMPFNDIDQNEAGYWPAKVLNFAVSAWYSSAVNGMYPTSCTREAALVR